MTTPACPGRYDDEATGLAIPCQWNHDPDGMHHAHDRTRCITWTDGAAGINKASTCPNPPAQERTEYGYLVEHADGTSYFNGFLGNEHDRALGQFNTLEVGPELARLVFVSRRVTETPWTEC